MIDHKELCNWFNGGECDCRAVEIAVMRESLVNMLGIHAADMKEAGFNPPVCDCELCVAAREAIRITDQN